MVPEIRKEYRNTVKRKYNDLNTDSAKTTAIDISI